MIANPCWLTESEVERARKEQARLEYEDNIRREDNEEFEQWLHDQNAKEINETKQSHSS